MRDPSTTFTWRLRALTRGPRQVTVFVRKHQFDVGAPLQFDVDDDRVCALEYALGGLVADMVGGFRTLARQRRIAVDDVEAVIEAQLDNALTHLGVIGEHGRPALACARVHVYVKSLEEETRIRHVWDEMLERSPLVSTLKQSVDIDVKLNVIF